MSESRTRYGRFRLVEGARAWARINGDALEIEVTAVGVLRVRVRVEQERVG